MFGVLWVACFKENTSQIDTRRGSWRACQDWYRLTSHDILWHATKWLYKCKYYEPTLDRYSNSSNLRRRVTFAPARWWSQTHSTFWCCTSQHWKRSEPCHYKFHQVPDFNGYRVEFLVWDFLKVCFLSMGLTVTIYQLLQLTPRPIEEVGSWLQHCVGELASMAWSLTSGTCYCQAP